MSLSVESITAGYGRMAVVRDASLSVSPGQIVAVLGRNGAGKTTLLRAVAGLQPLMSGGITVDGVAVSRRPAWRRARGGISLVLEGARLFMGQTVGENVALGRRHAADDKRGDVLLAAIHDTFPVIRDKHGVRAGQLSGGERMQVAVAQALVSGPRYLLLDEPSVGLSPAAARGLFEALGGLRAAGDGEAGPGVLIAEQMVESVLGIADSGVVLDHGRITVSGSAAELRGSTAVTDAYMGTGASAP